MKGIVTIAHGAGGRQTSRLIDQVFRKYFENPYLTSDDAAVLPEIKGRIVMTTDGFVVSPIMFPGGNIGKLSVCGTVNDLACMGAKPLFLTCAFVIEEGVSIELLEKITKSMAETAKEAGVVLVAGDTKVVGKGQVDQIFITTTGIGVLEGDRNLSGMNAIDGDMIVITGDIGRHGCCILLEREDFGIEANVESDCAPLSSAVLRLLELFPDIHVIRDATRGGVGTVLYEIAKESNVEILLNEPDIPIQPAVKSICGMLGMAPINLANEGTMVLVIPEKNAKKAVSVLREELGFSQAAIIGEIKNSKKGRVFMKTELGTTVIVPELDEEMLPRIC